MTTWVDSTLHQIGGATNEHYARADRVEQVAFGFLASKVLFSAIEFGLFTELLKGPMDAEQVRKRLELHPRSVRDFLDALVALGLLDRHGQLYSNTPETDFYSIAPRRPT